MIPALLAVPVVEGVVGGVMGSVANIFSPSTPPASASSTAFNPYLNKATAAAVPQPSPTTEPSGTMRADQWNQMGKADTQSWLKSLSGRHVEATDESGKTITGQVNGMQMLGNTMALNIGGHLVSLSQLKQVSWSPSVA
jgi:hypothetical protein